MRINNNISALNTLRQYTTNTNSTNKSMEKLSSGLRINRAGDDAAGLAISEKMRSQIRGIEMASKNSQDAISLVQTAEGALTETHSILQRMNELAVQSASDTNETIDRNALQAEFEQLTAEINDIASQTKFNNKYLLDGTYGGIMKATGTSASITDAMLTISQNIAVAGTYEFSYIDKAVNASDVSAMSLSGSSGVSLAADAVAGNYTITYNAAELIDTGGNDLTTAASSIAIDLDVAEPYTYTMEWDGVGNTLTITNTTTGASSGALAVAADGTADISFEGVTFQGIDRTEAAGLHNKSYSISAPSFTVELGGQALNPQDVEFNTATNKLTFNGVTLDLGTTAKSDLDTNLGSGKALGIAAATATVSVDGGAPQAAVVDADGTLKFNGITITGGTTATLSSQKLVLKESNLTIQTGANSGETLDIAIGAMSTDALKLNNLSIADKDSAKTVVDAVTDAINQVSTQRANLGAYQNRLEHKINNLNTSSENLQAAESRIRDVDMAAEMVEFTKNNILLQAAQSMLAQANAQPQGVLQLLQ